STRKTLTGWKFAPSGPMANRPIKYRSRMATSRSRCPRQFLKATRSRSVCNGLTSIVDGAIHRGTRDTMVLIHFHRLILPADANHHGPLYAGPLLRLALEAGYATAWKFAGTSANLVLRRVLNLECLRPVPVGTVIEIEGAVLHRSQAYLVTGLLGTSLKPG